MPKKGEDSKLREFAQLFKENPPIPQSQLDRPQDTAEPTDEATTQKELGSLPSKRPKSDMPSEAQLLELTAALLMKAELASKQKQLDFEKMIDKQAEAPLIVRFYDPILRAPDKQGRTLEQLLHWDDEHLERSHDYIQMAFPLPETSAFQYNAPTVDEEVVQAFRTRGELQAQLLKMLKRMLTFYGFTVAKEIPNEKNFADPVPPSAPELHVDGYHIVRGDNWKTASRNWVVRMDHNHLRITRILRCLRVLGCHHNCDAFFSALQCVYKDPKTNIGERSMQFWERAHKLPLHIAPDGQRVDWLKKWEDEDKEGEGPKSSTA